MQRKARREFDGFFFLRHEGEIWVDLMILMKKYRWIEALLNIYKKSGGAAVGDVLYIYNISVHTPTTPYFVIEWIHKRVKRRVACILAHSYLALVSHPGVFLLIR